MSVALLLAAGLAAAADPYVTAEAGCATLTVTTPHAFGTLVPARPTTVQLVRERIDVALHEDLVHADIVITSLLRNRGPAISLPVFVEIGESDDLPNALATQELDAVRLRQFAAVERDVHIEAGGKVLRCRATGVQPHRFSDATPGPLPSVVGRCTALLGVPAGTSEVRLRHRVPILRSDALHSPRQERSRSVVMTLAPPEAWAGADGPLHVQLDRGPWRSLATLRAIEAAPSAATLAWQIDPPPVVNGNVSSWQRPTGTERPWAVVVDVDAAAHLCWRRLTGALDPDAFAHTVSVTANGELPGNAAARAADRRADTAWCAPGPGVGRALELRFSKSDTDPVDRPMAIALIAGDARTAASWRKHGRPSRVAIERCGAPSTRIEASLGESAEPRVDVVPFGYELWEQLSREADVGEVCVRIEVLEVRRGDRSGAMCITEVRPHFSSPHGRRRRRRRQHRAHAGESGTLITPLRTRRGSRPGARAARRPRENSRRALDEACRNSTRSPT